MHDLRLEGEGRVQRFVRAHLRPAIYHSLIPLDITVWVAPGEPVSFAEAASQQFGPAQVGMPWGAPWSTTWFRVTGVLPEWWCERVTREDQPEVLIDLGFNLSRSGFQAEGLAYDLHGNIIKAVSPLNSQLPLFQGQNRVDYFVEAAGNPDFKLEDFLFEPTRLGSLATAGEDSQYVLSQADAGLRNVHVWELIQDITVLEGIMSELPVESARRAEILRGLEAMVDAVDPDSVRETAANGRAVLAQLFESRAAASAHQMVAVGHAHIDSAWMWPTRETIRKCARTFSNVLALMDENEDFVFAASSAQQYEWIRDSYPDLFERIAQRVREGRFVPVGGMWVESDTNMPSGEAFVRQLTFGRRFFREHFGIDQPEVWLPDSFGYSAALPQLMRLAGARWFLTQKISWNRTNRMPHHTFLWEGIDGSQIFTHFPPVDTYGSDLSMKELAHGERNYSEKGVASTSLVPFGWSDGGGGPTREMIAAATRMTSVEGAPRVTMGSPQEFFEAAAAEYVDPPVWSGELYLEFHRGIFTSQARTKRGNRESERLLAEVEYWATVAAIRTGSPYPYDELEAAWKTVLLQQFHDILPGTSIRWVHDQAEQNYRDLQVTLNELLMSRLQQLVGDGDRPLVVNSAPSAIGGVEARTVGELEGGEEPSTVTRLEGGGFQLRNQFLTVEVDARGQISSLVDVHSGRDAFAPGASGNILQLHRDVPNEWDAWDLDSHYRRISTFATIESAEIVEVGGVARVEMQFTIGASLVRQTLSLASGDDSLEIATEVEWRDKQKMLKLGFDFDLRAESTSSEIQFGHVSRALHTNTSWDAARFEFCAQRWIHATEPGYGVAVSNDAIYGHDATRRMRDDGGTTTSVRLSLLRAPLYPDPDSDSGQHSFSIRVRPDSSISDAIRLGHRSNIAPRALKGARTIGPLVSSSNNAVVIETVKLADDRSGDVILRLYEALGGRAETRLVVNFPFARAVETDLLESLEDASEIDVQQLKFRPCEVKTIRLTSAG